MDRSLSGRIPRRGQIHAPALRYLSEVARQGSVRRASKLLNVASSALSRQILHIEQDLGIKLFDRMQDGMRLTPAGEMLLNHARDTLYNYERVLADIDGLSGVRSGHVGIVALDSLLVNLLPAALEEVGRQYHAITFSVLAAAPATVFDEVAAGRAELGISFVAPVTPALKLVSSARAPLGAVMAVGHPLAGRKSLSFADLAGHPVLLQNEGVPASAQDDEFSMFRSSVRPRVMSNSIEMLRHNVQAGLGIAFFTRLGFLQDIAAGRLVWIPLAARRPEILEIGLYVPAQRTLSPAASIVADALVRNLADFDRGSQV